MPDVLGRTVAALFVLLATLGVAEPAGASCTAKPGTPAATAQCDDTIEPSPSNDVWPTVVVMAAGVLVVAGGWTWWMNRWPDRRTR
jgi:hypothetical protein